MNSEEVEKTATVLKESVLDKLSMNAFVKFYKECNPNADISKIAIELFKSHKTSDSFQAYRESVLATYLISSLTVSAILQKQYDVLKEEVAQLKEAVLNKKNGEQK